MITFFLVLHFFITISLVSIILIQKNEGGMGLGESSSIMSVRGSANLVTRVTSFLAACFMGNCLLLGHLAAKSDLAGNALIGNGKIVAPLDPLADLNKK